MPELRWTLLILGVLFVAALAWWELRRQRQAPRHGVAPPAHTASGREAERSAPAVDAGSNELRAHREPTISFPELQPEPRGEARMPMRPREPAQDPPIVELDSNSFAELRVEGETGDDEIAAAQLQRAAGLAEDDEGHDRWQDIQEGDAPLEGEPDDEPGDERTRRESSSTQTTSPESHYRENVTAPLSVDRENITAPLSAAGASAAGPPIVEWPAEEARKIIALRLVSAPAARFSGRDVRLALAAEGFVLGKFDIFHKPGPDERAMLSAASLTKPGTFTLNTIDGQRFGGLSLFAVLPGPLPAQQVFDQLLSTARSLNDRLQGALQDERGEPLTPMRSANIRETLSSAPAEGPQASGHSGAAHPAEGSHSEPRQ